MTLHMVFSTLGVLHPQRLILWTFLMARVVLTLSALILHVPASLSIRLLPICPAQESSLCSLPELMIGECKIYLRKANLRLVFRTLFLILLVIFAVALSPSWYSNGLCTFENRYSSSSCPSSGGPGFECLANIAAGSASYARFSMSLQG